MKILDYDKPIARDLMFLLDHLNSKDLEIETLKVRLEQSEYEANSCKEKYMALLEKLA